MCFLGQGSEGILKPIVGLEIGAVQPLKGKLSLRNSRIQGPIRQRSRRYLQDEPAHITGISTQHESNPFGPDLRWHRNHPPKQFIEPKLIDEALVDVRPRAHIRDKPRKNKWKQLKSG
ncbi:hypothetical protein F511_18007 [Dorcoceras hygrometricum]|uniref:Uncharacterized protein n=1 Tax=Dorcoceras hygrometricum TaxID=472368 RepID=A0A2Z7DCA7_9LAMI|nr:hypothetical protein F511_18007 [Dorcoceras hygrometricum]